MKTSEHKLVEWLLRITLSIGMLSAVADRFGIWSQELSAWGNWQNFLAYTQQLNPWIPSSLISTVGGTATFLEVLFGIGLLNPVKTSEIAKGTGVLLLLFGISMATFLTIKAPLDYSVFVGAAAAFSLSLLTKK